MIGPLAFYKPMRDNFFILTDSNYSRFGLCSNRNNLKTLIFILLLGREDFVRHKLTKLYNNRLCVLSNLKACTSPEKTSWSKNVSVNHIPSSPLINRSYYPRPSQTRSTPHRPINKLPSLCLIRVLLHTPDTSLQYQSNSKFTFTVN